LNQRERERVIEVLHSERFVDRSPAEVFATLLDEEEYLCSERTMYRILAENQPVRERRNQLQHPDYEKPELLATAPNQVWSWDITKLLGPKKWTYYYLYVLLDIFSRYAVGWMVADRENSALAGRLIEESCTKHGVEPEVLTLHSDRGSPMTSKCTAQLLADLGVTRSLSRPQVSDDNPFSEAQFKTLKYHPGFPGRFTGIDHATRHCRSFFPWYNTEHRHGGISMLTPADVHYGRAQAMLEQRQRTLADAWAAHPERFVHGICVSGCLKVVDGFRGGRPKCSIQLSRAPSSRAHRSNPLRPLERYPAAYGRRPDIVRPDNVRAGTRQRL
jgi:putative transposase